MNYTLLQKLHSITPSLPSAKVDALRVEYYEILYQLFFFVYDWRKNPALWTISAVATGKDPLEKKPRNILSLG